MLARRILVVVGLWVIWSALGGLFIAPVVDASTEPADGAALGDEGASVVAPPVVEMPYSGAFLPELSPTYATGKWIDVNLSRQRITAYLGGRVIRSVLVSTGTSRHPTVVGRFAVYRKVHSQTMSGGSRAAGDYYRLPGVPHVMYFYSAYAIHGTYWHHNFGRRMSHGCVNLTLRDADWFYSWAPLRTPVVSHY